MKYEELLSGISKLVGQPEETIKKIMLAIPEVLTTMNEKDMIRTPLGVFRMTKRASRMVRPPKGRNPVRVPEKMVVKLRSGNRMRKPDLG